MDILDEVMDFFIPKSREEGRDILNVINEEDTNYDDIVDTELQDTEL